MDITHALTLALLLGLGTARIAALISSDKITAPIRDLIFHWYPPEDNDREGRYYQSLTKADPKERKSMASWDIPWWQKRWTVGGPIRKPRFLGELIACHKCSSVWVASANIIFYFLWPEGAVVLNTVAAVALISTIAYTHFDK